MTIFAGVFALDASRDVTDGMARELAGAISRHPDDKPSLTHGPGCALAYVELACWQAVANTSLATARNLCLAVTCC